MDGCPFLGELPLGKKVKLGDCQKCRELISLSCQEGWALQTATGPRAEGTAMSIRITNKAVEVYDAEGQLVVWELHHATSRRSAAFYLGTVCEVYGINDADLNAQIIAAVRGE